MKGFPRVTVLLQSLFCLTLLVGAVVSPVQAQTPIPLATFREELTRFPGDTGPTGDLHLPESDMYSAIRIVGQHTGTSSSFVQIRSLPFSPAVGGPVLQMSGSAFNQGPTDPDIATHLLAGGAGARAEVEYFFRIIASPSIVSIPLLLPVNFSLHSEIDFGTATSFTEWSVSVRRVFRSQDVAFGSRFTRVGPGFPGLTRDLAGTDVLSFNAVNGFLTGEYYRVRMVLRGAAGWDREAGDEASPATGSFEAMLDPLPRVDPDFPDADQVQFEFSENLFSGSASAAPEPGTLAFLSTGISLAAVAFLRRRVR
jgi:hypothetical protein